MAWRALVSPALSRQVPTFQDRPQYQNSVVSLKVFLHLRVKTHFCWKYVGKFPMGHSLFPHEDPWGQTLEQQLEIWLPSSTDGKHAEPGNAVGKRFLCFIWAFSRIKSAFRRQCYFRSREGDRKGKTVHTLPFPPSHTASLQLSGETRSERPHTLYCFCLVYLSLFVGL